MNSENGFQTNRVNVSNVHLNSAHILAQLSWYIHKHKREPNSMLKAFMLLQCENIHFSVMKQLMLHFMIREEYAPQAVCALPDGVHDVPKTKSRFWSKKNNFQFLMNFYVSKRDSKRVERAKF